MEKISYATIGLGEYLSNRLKDSELIELAFIYGSVANDEETKKSDIDLFVVGEVEEEKLQRLVFDIDGKLAGKSITL